jgi:hypothetical protein
MILEETSGDVSVTINGKKVVVGSSFEDSMYPIALVIGNGKAIFRVDSSTTLEQKGIEVLEAMSKGLGIPATAPEPTPAPATTPVEAAPVAERVSPPVETPSEPTKEA